MCAQLLRMSRCALTKTIKAKWKHREERVPCKFVVRLWIWRAIIVGISPFLTSLRPCHLLSCERFALLCSLHCCITKYFSAFALTSIYLFITNCEICAQCVHRRSTLVHQNGLRLKCMRGIWLWLLLFYIHEHRKEPSFLPLFSTHTHTLLLTCSIVGITELLFLCFAIFSVLSFFLFTLFTNLVVRHIMVDAVLDVHVLLHKL